MKIDYERELNPPQWEAVRHAEGPLLIVAGAGSGKTRVITYKVAYLIDSGRAHPAEILAVTFTNKAAREMRERVENLLGNLAAAPLICTFHSFGVRVLRRHAERLGFRRDFTIYDVDDQKRLLRRIQKDLGLSSSSLPVDRVRSVISRAKNQRWSPEDYLVGSHDFDAAILAEIFRRYQTELRRSGGMDFDDLILLTVELFQRFPDLAESYSRRYRFLLVDEYQDTNSLQCELLRLLTCAHRNITAVGDEDQAIYGFRGADVTNILRFEEQFPGARVIKLQQNYRSTANILEAASALVSHNENRREKRLWTEAGAGDLLTMFVAEDPAAEAEFVAREVGRFLEWGESGIAVLYRTNFQSRQFEEVFRRWSIPYRLVGGVSFYERKEVRDALAYLKVIRRPDDDISLLRIINEPSRGIGAATIQRLQEHVHDHGGSLWQAIQWAVEERTLGPRAVLSLKAFGELIEGLRTLSREAPAIALDEILKRSGYRAALEMEDTEEAGDRLLNLQELLTVASGFGPGDESWQEFLDQGSLHTELDEIDEHAAVTLMTLHNAKGLEFSVVFLVGLEDGLFPHARAIEDRAIEEERRLCYVGLTRAKKKLYLTYSRRRRLYGASAQGFSTPSRFLKELPRELLEVQGEFAFGRRTYDTPVELKAAALQSLESNRKGRPFSGNTLNTVADVKRALADRTENEQVVEKPARFRVGELVRHERFGVGQVLAVEPADEDDLKVTVRFLEAGVKRLLQRYARLQRA
ncbi:MAG TPA: UvrD-helicase domain-containing protein [Acidobacteriota bacterium]|nr:UvrD-helicase domain-containing protein [Acidobacteriota bacterium]